MLSTECWESRLASYLTSLGGGAPCRSRAAEKDSQGGAPPAPHTWPVFMRSIHHASEAEEAKSPLSLCRHMSTESTNSWWPWGKM